MKCRVRDKHCFRLLKVYRTHLHAVHGWQKETSGSWTWTLNAVKWQIQSTKEALRNQRKTPWLFTTPLFACSSLFSQQISFTSCLSCPIKCRVFAVLWIWNIRPFRAWSCWFMVDCAVPQSAKLMLSGGLCLSRDESGAHTEKVNFNTDFHNCSVIETLRNTLWKINTLYEYTDMPLLRDVMSY